MTNDHYLIREHHQNLNNYIMIERTDLLITCMMQLNEMALNEEGYIMLIQQNELVQKLHFLEHHSRLQLKVG